MFGYNLMKTSTIKLSLFLSLLLQIFSLAVAPTLAPNSLYSHAGSAVFDTSSYIGTTTNILNPATITITYPQSPASSGYRFGYSIKQIDYQIMNNRMNYSLQINSLSSSSASLDFYTDNANHLLTFVVGYLTIEPIFGNYYFSYKWMTPNRNLYNGDTVTETSPGQGPFNTSLTHQLWITIVGVQATMAANNEIDLYPNAAVTDTTTITYTVQTISPTTFYLNSVLIHAFIYSAAELAALERPMHVTQGGFLCLHNSATLSYTSSISQIDSFNVLMGMKEYHIVSLGHLNYLITITPQTSITASSAYYLQYADFNFIILTFPFCQNPTPHLLVSNDTCLDQCPERYCVNNYNQCFPCVNAKLETVMKQPFENKVTLSYSFDLIDLKDYPNLNWSDIVTQTSGNNIAFKNFQYNSQTGYLDVKIEYFEDINDKQLQLSFDFHNSSPFQQLPVISSTSTLKTTNNLELKYYPDQEYTTAKVLSYIVAAVAILAFLMYLLGFYCTKLVALQLVTIYQLTFFSLSSLSDLSPNYQALTNLYFSNGFNPKLFSSDTPQTRFFPLSMVLSLLNNYNITVLVVIVPLLLSLALHLINKCKYQNKNESLSNRSLLSRGEMTFYGLMFSAYNVNVSLVIVIKHFGETHTIDVIGFVFGLCVLLTTLIYGIILLKVPEAFGEFNTHLKKFVCEIPIVYMLMVLERLIIGTCVGLVSSQPLNYIIMYAVLSQFLFICLKKPYIKDGKERRPYLNLLISFFVQLLIVLTNVVGSTLDSYDHYAPIAIIVLLLLALAYNLYYFIQSFRAQVKQELRESKEEDENKMLNSQRAKIKELNSIFLNRSGSILSSSAEQAAKEVKDQNNLLILREKLVKVKDLYANKANNESVNDDFGRQISRYP